MGCAGSKLDDLPALALCRDRAALLESAIRYRYTLSQSHLSYIQSLHALGISLHRFFDADNYNEAPLSPLLPLPTQRKLDPDPDPDPIRIPSSSSPPPVQIPAAAARHSRSDSGSHLHFHSSDSDSDSDAHSSPLHDHVHGVVHDEGPTTSPARYNTYYMQSRPTVPTVETVHFSEPSSSYSYPYFYSNYNDAGYGGFFGSPPQQQQQQMMQPPPYGYYSSSSTPPPPPAEASSSRPPPPPPSPPRASAWEFLNPFGAFESSYPTPYSPSRDSKEVREEEGIPDLEDEEYQHEVVKEVHGEQKFVVDAGDGARFSTMQERGIGSDAIYHERGGGFGESGGVEYKVHMVEKNVVADEERPEDRRSNVGPVKGHGGSRSVLEVVVEIKAQFDRASESGTEVSKMLEVGKLPYCGKNAVYKVSSKMLDVITPLSVVSSQPSTSKSAEQLPSSEDASSLSLDYDRDMGLKSGSLSCTLEKLYIWEKKLYQEVKAEEKMRIIHERKSRRLKHLDEKGAESHKVDATRTLVRKLSTKIRIAIQVVDSISNKINKLRDQELWTQTNELVQGLFRMWKVMHECHRIQCQIIAEAKNLDAIAFNRKLSDAHMKATVQLELDLLNWILSFYAWIGAQKGYVKALNGWLLKCIHYEPEETVDGVVPFSPGRIGAPPVFVIFNQWSQAMDRISENEVFVALRAFSMSVFRLWVQHNLAQRQSMMVNKDMDGRVKSLEREEQRMQKALDTVNKKLVLVSEESGLPLPGQIDPSHASEVESMQVGLKQIFVAMEKFSDESMKAYEELHMRSEEDRRAQENAKA